MTKRKLNNDNAIDSAREFERVMEGIKNIAEKGWLETAHFGKPKNGLVRLKLGIAYPGDDDAEREIEDFQAVLKAFSSKARSSMAYLSKKGGTNV